MEKRALQPVNIHAQHKGWVSVCREELKGFAILWVVFFHALLSCTGVLYDIKKIGYGGVDIFIFLTGFGLYHSLQKNENIPAYWKRRMKRILPAYVPFILLWLAVMLPCYGLSATQAIRTVAGNLFMVGYWLNVPKAFNWYIGGLLLLMALAPFCYGLLAHSKAPQKTLLYMLLVFFLVGLCCIGDDRYMGLSRLPVFVLGMAFAMDWKQAWRKSHVYATLLCGFGAGLFALLLCFARYPELLNTYGMYWHPFVLIVPPLSIFLAFLMQKQGQARKIFLPLRYLGKASFEIYLFNIWLVELGKRNQITGDIPWLLTSLASVALGLLYHRLVRMAVRRGKL